MTIKYVLGEYKVHNNTIKQYLIPLSEEEMLGKYGHSSAIIYAYFNNRKLQARMNFWHDNETSIYLDLMKKYYEAFQEACINKHYMSYSMTFLPMKKSQVKYLKVFKFSPEEWTKDYFANLISLMSKKQEELDSDTRRV